MDRIIDYESYQSLKQSYDQLMDCNAVLEEENESLLNSNQLLKRLMISLEAIKTSLEQKVLILQSNGSVEYTEQLTEQLVPFDRELQRLDEEYCQLKTDLNRLEFGDEDVNNGSDDGVDGEDIRKRRSPSVDTKDGSEAFSAATRLVDQLNDDEIDDNCVQYVVHQVMPSSGEGVSDSGDAQHDSSAEYISISATPTTAKTPKRGRRPRPPQRAPGVKRFRCSWEGCEYATDSSGNFQKHYRIHTGEKPYKCDFDGCEYSCSDPGSIKEHKRIHMVEKQYSCDWPGCSWKFSTYKLLKNHVKACHTLEKPHKCDWPGCEKSFLAPYALRTHKLKHTGERPNKCDVEGCRAAFTRTTDLARHKRETHCPERQYVCEHENCGSKFYRKDDLRHHIRRKHDYPQFGRRRAVKSKARPKIELTNVEKLAKKYKRLVPSATSGAGGEATAAEPLEEHKVVIDLNVAKVNQLKKSIQINFV